MKSKVFFTFIIAFLVGLTSVHSYYCSQEISKTIEFDLSESGEDTSCEKELEDVEDENLYSASLVLCESQTTLPLSFSYRFESFPDVYKEHWKPPKIS